MDFEEMLRHLALLGVAAFFIWLVAEGLGLIAGFAEISSDPAIRFMAAILVLMLPYVVYPDLKAMRYRGLAPDERREWLGRPFDPEEFDPSEFEDNLGNGRLAAFDDDA